MSNQYQDFGFTTAAASHMHQHFMGPLMALTPTHKPRLRVLDVGCGNGAFTQLIAEQCELRAWGGGSPCALRRRRYNASIEGGWHGAHRHDTARNKEAAKNFARQRLQCLLASARTLPPPPLDRCGVRVGAGMADAVSGSSQRRQPGLPNSPRPSCHLGGGQPGPCQPP